MGSPVKNVKIEWLHRRQILDLFVRQLFPNKNSNTWFNDRMKSNKESYLSLKGLSHIKFQYVKYYSNVRLFLFFSYSVKISTQRMSSLTFKINRLIKNRSTRISDKGLLVFEGFEAHQSDPSALNVLQTIGSQFLFFSYSRHSERAQSVKFKTARLISEVKWN